MSKINPLVLNIIEISSVFNSKQTWRWGGGGEGTSFSQISYKGKYGHKQTYEYYLSPYFIVPTPPPTHTIFYLFIYLFSKKLVYLEVVISAIL